MNNQSDPAWDALQNELGASFLQSAGWAAFQQALGVPTQCFHGQGWSALCLEYKTPAGKYWFLPYGPTFTSETAFKECLKRIKQQAKKANVAWLRIEPFSPVADMARLEPLARRTSQHLNPEYSIVNDLTEDESSMRSRLTPNKRNLINRGTKRGLRFERSVDPADISIFTDMLHVTEQRTGARSHDDSYYRTQAETLMPLGMLELYIARGPENQPLSSMVLISYGGTISRVYAGSYPEARKFEAGVGLDWYAMLNAKAEGLKRFDFYGAAAPDAAADHPFAGFTKYKSEFGGKHVRHGGTWDIPLQPLRYKSYQLLRHLKSR